MRRPFASGHENVAMRCARNLLNETLKAFTNSESPPGTVTEGPLLPVRAYLGQGGVEQPAGLVARGREREPSILPRLRAARANITAYATQPSRQKLTRIPTRDLKSPVSRGRRLATPQGGEVSSTPLQLLTWLWAGALVPLTPPSSSANGPGSLHWQVPRDPSLTPGLAVPWWG